MTSIGQTVAQYYGIIKTCLALTKSITYGTYHPNTVRNASTTLGSSCVPDDLLNSARMNSIVLPLLYGLSAFMASKVSATARIRAERGMDSPFRPSGYPVPS